MNKIAALAAILLMLTACSGDEGNMKGIKPPVAEKVKHDNTVNGMTVSDNYDWLRDPKWPDVSDDKVLQYLKDENEYSEVFFGANQAFQDKLFEEMKGRIKLTDESVPVKKGDFVYYSKTDESLDYPIYCRKRGKDGAEEVILDLNELSKNKKFIRLSALAISHDNNKMAYSIDDDGSERYTIFIYDFENGVLMDDRVENTIGSIVWNAANDGVFYTPVDEQWRHRSVKLHKLGTAGDAEVFNESDQMFSVNIKESASKKYLIINSSSASSSATFAMSTDGSTTIPKALYDKKDTVYSDADHTGGVFYLHVNDNGRNFRVMKASEASVMGFTSGGDDTAVKSTPMSYDMQVERLEDKIVANAPEKKPTDVSAKEKRASATSWEEYIAHDDKRYLKSISCSKNYLVADYKVDGLDIVEVFKLPGKEKHTINFPDASYIAFGKVENADLDDIRVVYESPKTPRIIYSYDFGDDKLNTLKAYEIPSGFNPNSYVLERIFANTDGVKVPITILYRKDNFKTDGSNLLYLYGYGSYGISVPTGFSNYAISLVNRGFIYAIAHVRGGDDLGFKWYESAKLLTKKKTFDDFLACAHTLIEKKYAAPKHISIEGASAGGMLMGYVLNQEPELFQSAILQVPFVDVLNTMLDDSLPLTPGEYKEWGDPKDKKYFEYIKSYSPYDNISSKTYPHMLVTAGLTDPRVGYWEPAKYVAKLRDMKKDDNMLFLKTNMHAGHGGATQRDKKINEDAQKLMFILKTFGLTQ